MSGPPMLRLETFLPEGSRAPFYIAHSIFKESTEVPEHSHAFYEFFVVRRGRLIHTLNGAKQEMESRSLKFIFPSDVHAFKKHPKSDFSILTNLAFSSAVVDRVCSMLGVDFSGSRGCFAPYAFYLDDLAWNGMIKKMDQLIDLAQNDLDTYQTALFYSLLLDVFAELLGVSGTVRDSAPKWLSGACREMQKKENFLEGLRKFVALSGKSQEHLTRKLRECYNISPSRFINNLRLEEAAQILINSDQSVAELCFETGFENLSYFIKLFKEKYGVSPLKYRQQNMKNVRYHEFYNLY